MDIKNDSDILNYFPNIPGKIEKPRQCQVDVLKKVDDLIQNGRDKIIICAPTGSGKSGIATTLLNKYGGTYTSPLNVLVDQIKDDFDPRYVISLKGREHYQCIANTDNGYVSCADGFCQIGKCSIPEIQQDLSGKHIEIYKKRNCKDCDNVTCACNNCEYKHQKDLFQSSNAGNTNFTMFQLGITNDKDMIVIDESDDIESFIRMNNSFTIDESILTSDFEEHVLILYEKEIELETDIENIKIAIENSVTTEEAIEYNKEKRRLENLRKNINTLLEDWEDNGKIWNVTRPENNKTKYEPIIIDRFLNKLIEGKIAVLMSATPIILDGFEVIEIGSQFPKSIRPWKFVPLGKMSMAHREHTIPQVAQFISVLEGKTVVHCNSYAVANTISKELDILGKSYLKQVNYNSYNPLEYGRKDIVPAFKKSSNPNEVLLSVNLARGVDFPEDDIKNNVIVVLPWPNPTDPLVKQKNKVLGASWQHVDMANTIMQAYGRVNRNDKKSTMTYIVDENFNNKNGRGVAKNWFDLHRDLFFDWFLEAEHSVANNMVLCPVCGNEVDYVYSVFYPDYNGKTCHNCNKKMFKDHGGK